LGEIIRPHRYFPATTTHTKPKPHTRTNQAFRTPYQQEAHSTRAKTTVKTQYTSGL